MIAPYIQGFVTGGGLIVAIGAQNAFVLSQGIRKNHHKIIALVCIICDSVFITVGVAGVGAVICANPAFSQWVTWGGAAFLLFYGGSSLRSAIRGGRLEGSDRVARSLSAAVFTTLAVTLLNPHFYLDTVLLLGSISSRYQEESRLFFLAGAISASTLWFISLSIGGQMLAPLFKKQISWRILDGLVCVTMWFMAVLLLADNQLTIILQ
ncbi:MAG: LysE/ArgO family amino acid transporter [Desulfobacterales bacterium]|nr:LysE/ArgO family amino acid transporter [Desulfobacterales bacterium]